MIHDKYKELQKVLLDSIPAERIITDELRLLAYGTDASFYRLIPKLIVKVKNNDDAAFVIKEAGKLNIPLTFRAAGTSLSGQAITDSVLVLIDNDWKGHRITENGFKIAMEPGLVGGFANLYLSPFNRKLGPDPASINSAKISGIASNNASGMTSGTENNIYNTLDSMQIIFSDGSILDTGDLTSREEFKKRHPKFISRLTDLREKVKADRILSDRIRFKYRMKNTTGYGLNALIDFEDPFDMIAHLMIGSEGTLGFISEITLRTVPDLPFKATSLMLFENIESACEAIPVFKELPVDAAEIMDRAALRSVEDKPGMPPNLKSLKEESAALLVETSAETRELLLSNIEKITGAVAHLPKAFPIEFTDDKNKYKKLWDVRKGLFPSVCKSRAEGTTVIIEDVNFPVERLAEAALDLQRLFKEYEYKDTIIWGHSLSGNLHFVLTQNFASDSELNRYKYFMEALTELVVKKYDGSLKAEHGTGRNMAPFVRYEWGEGAFELMKEIKSLFDPYNIFNPGVVINDDPNIHIKNLKPLPAAHPLIDQCIECGFCEVNCPSKNLTLTPRQRIVVWREINRLREEGRGKEMLKNFERAYDYYGDQTCATDGLCALSCPVDIDTGKLIKDLRYIKLTPGAKKAASFIAEHMELVTLSARVGLDLAYFARLILGEKMMRKLGGLMRRVSRNKIPEWIRTIPKGADSTYPNYSKPGNDLTVVYFPSCISRSMGIAFDDASKDSQATVFHRLLIKAGINIIYPDKLDGLCCGMPFSSKGFKTEGAKKSGELLEKLRAASNNGEHPILFDTSPCTYHLKEFADGSATNLKIYEPIEFTLKFLKDRLIFSKLNYPVAIHTTCSSSKMGLEESFKEAALLCCEEIIIPESVGCCGFAGDRGFSYPELNESALQDLKDSLPPDCREGYSTSRTCEIGLSLHSGISYVSLFYLLDKCSRSAK